MIAIKGQGNFDISSLSKIKVGESWGYEPKQLFKKSRIS